MKELNAPVAHAVARREHPRVVNHFQHIAVCFKALVNPRRLLVCALTLHQGEKSHNKDAHCLHLALRRQLLYALSKCGGIAFVAQELTKESMLFFLRNLGVFAEV